ncbi:hypothetical protein FBY35_0122 [Streptomyces sp. SLBN-118]|nr:hypothetical protein FBY35_0122 [Streptomyces sp. SLBN-118]
MEPSSITVLITFVGGPADGRTQHIPLTRLKDEITVAGVPYRTKTGGAPELTTTPEGAAQIFRPV